MIIALFALSTVMIVGGIASVIQGFPFVRLESGLAMTIAGATTASAGAVLLGIAVLALRLKSLQKAVAEGGSFGGETLPVSVATPERMEAPAPEPAAGPPTIDPIPARQRPSLAGTGAVTAGLGLGSLAGLSATRRGTEPTFEAPPEADEAEPLLPDLLPKEPDWHPEPPASEPEIRTEVERYPLLATPEPDAEPVAVAEETPAPPAEEPHPEPAAVADADAPHAAPPEEDALQVVGTYASGGNTYVMFSNGSIEADTPRGRFTFSSLDELKVFVESGGESDARGAA